jgi:colanic acid biosynthesis glycosyl transferase WcaI
LSKNKANIAIITPFFYPEPISTGKFNTEMVLALKEKGHHVEVFCFHPFYPEWRITKSNDQLEGITIYRGGRFIRFGNNATVRRIILELSFLFFILRSLRKIRRNSDIIIPVFPPSLAFYLSQFFFKKKTKKVGMVHDLQEIYSDQKEGLLGRIISKCIHFVEKGCYHACDSLVFLSNEMKEVAAELYGLPSSKLKVQYPFINIKSTCTTNDLEQLLPNEKKHIVYSGALGEKQNPQGLLALFQYCSTYLTSTTFHVFSQGKHFEELKSLNKNSNIKFHPLVPKKNIEELYQRSHIQLVPQLPGTSKGSLPSKLPNLLFSGTHVVCITDKGSEIEYLFKENNFKTIITSWNKEKIKDIFDQLLDIEKENTDQIKKSNQIFQLESMVAKILN